jgi:hypothetical protein
MKIGGRNPARREKSLKPGKNQQEIERESNKNRQETTEVRKVLQ